ncbi:hypothetical protein KFU94_49200 [Chloroflexi bacterium TSY]|nr:hypothetical protein [Chloroflexi bacterium TSY]
MSPIIQEIVNLPGWQPGNPIVIIVSGEGLRVAESFDGDEHNSTRLRIEYEE